MSYAVVFTYSFDFEVAVYLFDTEQKAVEFLRGSYIEEMRIESVENGLQPIGYISKDGWYAKIQTMDDADLMLSVTEFRIGRVYA